MDGPTTPDGREAGDAGFVDHLRYLASSFSSYLGSRFELAGIESKEAFANYLWIILFVVAGLVVLIFGYVFLCVAAVFLIRHFTGIAWFWIMLGVGVLHIALAGTCAFLAKSRFALPMFTFTLTEFKKDKEWLRTPTRSIAKRELARELERARRGLTRGSRGTRRDLNVGVHAREAFGRNRKVWLSGAALLGWLISKMPPRTQKVKVLIDKHDHTKIKEVKEAGILMVIVKLIIGLLKPMVMAYMTKKIADLGQSSQQAVEQSEQVVEHTKKVAEHTENVAEAAKEA